MSTAPRGQAHEDLRVRNCLPVREGEGKGLAGTCSLEGEHHQVLMKLLILMQQEVQHRISKRKGRNRTVGRVILFVYFWGRLINWHLAPRSA